MTSSFDWQPHGDVSPEDAYQRWLRENAVAPIKPAVPAERPHRVRIDADGTLTSLSKGA